MGLSEVSVGVSLLAHKHSQALKDCDSRVQIPHPPLPGNGPGCSTMAKRKLVVTDYDDDGERTGKFKMEFEGDYFDSLDEVKDLLAETGLDILFGPTVRGQMLQATNPEETDEEQADLGGLFEDSRTFDEDFKDENTGE